MAQRVRMLGGADLAIELERVARRAIAAASGESLVRAAASGEHAALWAVGKAAVAMARGAGPAAALIITKEGAEGGAPAGARVRVAAHPIPDRRGEAAARLLLDEAAALPPAARALLLLSGGASALLAAPVVGVTFDELAEATRRLLLGGASIVEINRVRRRLGAALGGRLAVACGGRLDVLALSDVAGDDPAVIGSGPASAGDDDAGAAVRVALQVGLDPALVARLPALAPPAADHPALARVRYRVLAGPERLVTLAADAARAAGWTPRSRGATLAGPVDDAAAALLVAAARLAAGEVLVAVGEPTVTVRGAAAGGRAQHLALLLARGLAGGSFAAVVCGSDGSDGTTAAAGARVDGATWARAGAAGLDAAGALAGCTAHPLLAALGACIVTGPTGTNLTDLVLIARGTGEG